MRNYRKYIFDLDYNLLIPDWSRENDFLKRTGLYNYIDKIVAGEDAMKPDLESFELAIGSTNKEDCIMIGDSVKSDKVGAENAGIDFYMIDKEHSIRDLLQLIVNSNGKEIQFVKKN